ncbi:non-specific lipid-transfer protein, partial [Clostridium perfringens]|nr:non-specific lipid-transfer protein [Clostridium perfringens]
MAIVEMVRKVALVAVFFYCLVVAVPRAVEGAITCELVVSDLAPCAGFLTTGGQVSTDCCNGVKSLKNAAATKDDRQMVCRCAEQTVSTLPGINLDNVRDLPGKCGVDFPYQVTPN